MKRACEACGNAFEVGRSNTRKTCSRACWLKWRARENRVAYHRQFGRQPPPERPPIRLTDAQKGYIAGILDGEGHLGIMARKRIWKRSSVPYYHRPIVQIGQSKMPILTFIMDVLQERDLGLNKQRQTFNLRLHPPCLKWLLPRLLPYLVLKRRQAEILLEFMERCRQQGKELTEKEWNARERLRAEISSLNVKPNAKTPLANHGIKVWGPKDQ